ncbi:MAG: DUF2288 domain-containing protein [Leptolyngbyaceae cyanobacterium]
MTESLHTQLTQDIDLARWSWLESHAQRDAIVLVNPALSLAEVGVAIATDNTQIVQHWIAEQLLLKPTQTQIIEWDAQKVKEFRALIIQPYVLIQEVQPTNPSPLAPAES